MGRRLLTRDGLLRLIGPATARAVVPLRPTTAWRVGLGAAGVRVLWVAGTARAPGGLSDPLLYQRFAQGIARGEGYVSFYGRPTAYYPPGYPLFLGAIQWVMRSVGAGGSLHWGTGVVQAALGGVTAVAVAVAGARWFGARVGVIAGVIIAGWPNLIAYSSTLLSESLYLPLFAVFLAGVSRLGSATGPRWWRPALVAALALGLATLVRPQVLAAVPALVVADLVAGRWRDGLRWAAALMAGATLVVAPWFVRNLVVMDHPIAVSTNGGDNLCVGFHNGAPGHFVVPPACDTGEFYIDGPAAEVRRNSETSRRARAWVAGHLGELPALSVRKLWYTYQADTDGLRAVEAYEQNRFLPAPLRTGLRGLANGTYLAVLLAWAAGMAVLARRVVADRRSDSGRAAARVAALCVSAMVVPVLVFGDGRFKVPATPAIAIVAAVGTSTVARRRGAVSDPAGQRGPGDDDPAAAAAASRASEASERRATSPAATMSAASQSAT